MKILAIILFITPGFISPCLGQTRISYNDKKYSLSHFTDENGLPRNSVRAIAMGNDGYIWLAAEVALCRFDGNRFYVYNQSNLNIKTNTFFTLRTRADLPKSLSLKSGYKSKSDAVTFPSILDAGSNGEAFFRIESGKVFADLAYTKKIYTIPQLKGSGWPILYASNSSFISNKIPDPSIYVIPDISGSFFVCSHSKIEFFTNWKKKLETPFQNDSLINFFLKDHRLFYANTNGTITKFGPGTSQNLSLSGEIVLDRAYLPKKKNYHVYWNMTSNQVFLYLNKNLYETYETGTGELRTKLVMDSFDLIANNVVSIHYDKYNKRFFMGSSNRGLFVMTEKSFHAVSSPVYGGEENIFYAQTPFAGTSVLNPRGIILTKDLQSGRITQHIATGISKLRNWDIYSILTDKLGHIWLKNFERLYKFEKNGVQQLKSWRIKVAINQLYEGLDGKIWLGTRQGGLLHISPGQSALRQLPAKSRIDDVSFMTQNNTQTLWVGTGKGLYTLDLTNYKRELIPGTGKMYIRSIYLPPGKKNEVWFTVYGQGIFLLRSNRLIKFPLDVNNHLADAHCIVADKKGFFWIPTNHGLFQLSRTDLLSYAQKPFNPYYHFYDKSSGFQTNEFNGGCEPCSVRLSNGLVSLPSLDGLVWFKPENINADLPDKPIVMDQYEILGKKTDINNDTLYFPLSPRQVIIHFSTPYHGNPINLSIDYALTEHRDRQGNEVWLPVNTQGKNIHLGNMESGIYRLHIRKKNGFGVNNYENKVITIIVPEQWYETTLFRVLLMFALLFAAVTYFRYRLRHLERRNRWQEIAIQKRTSELRHMLTALQSSEKELARQMHIQTRLLASISHDVKTPLKFMRSIIEKIESSIAQKKYENLSSMTHIIGGEMASMYELLENLTNFLKLQVYGKKIKLDKVNLNNLVLTKTGLFKNLLQQNGNTVLNEIPEDLTVLSERHMLSILIHNLIDNAGKYCNNATIRIYTKQDGNSIHLIIMDNGPGLPESLAAWMNADSVNESSVRLQALGDNYSGLGLLLIKEISSLLGIKLKVERSHGTTIHLIFNDRL